MKILFIDEHQEHSHPRCWLSWERKRNFSLFVCFPSKAVTLKQV